MFNSEFSRTGKSSGVDTDRGKGVTLTAEHLAEDSQDGGIDVS